jgi:ribonuclease H / adenosylcobalamin/alpha-ribazole phosphatase
MTREPSRRRPRRAGRAASDAERRRLAQRSRERQVPSSRGRPLLWCDGGSRGNPGPSAYGYVLEDGGGRVLAEGSGAAGVTTASVAEYIGLVAGLRHAVALALERLEVRMDSQLTIAQLTGEREVKNPVIRRLWEEARAVAVGVGPVVYRWIPREENGRANRLVAEALELER